MTRHYDAATKPARLQVALRRQKSMAKICKWRKKRANYWHYTYYHPLPSVRRTSGRARALGIHELSTNRAICVRSCISSSPLNAWSQLMLCTNRIMCCRATVHVTYTETSTYWHRLIWNSNVAVPKKMPANTRRPLDSVSHISIAALLVCLWFLFWLTLRSKLSPIVFSTALFVTHFRAHNMHDNLFIDCGKN